VSSAQAETRFKTRQIKRGDSQDRYGLSSLTKTAEHKGVSDRKEEKPREEKGLGGTFTGEDRVVKKQWGGKRRKAMSGKIC